MNFRLFILILTLPHSLWSQNIFNNTNSLNYTNYLIKSKEYQLAFDEISRIESVSTSDSSTLYYLQICYLTNNKERLFARIKNERNPNKIISNQILAYCLLYDSTQLALLYLNQFPHHLIELDLLYLLSSNKYDSANSWLKTFGSNIPDSNYYAELIAFRKNYSPKKKWIAITMSTIIPASGKYYLQQSFDASVALTLCAIHGTLAVYAFLKYGSSSLFAWANASAYTLFYLGNIVGTKTAYIRYINKNQLVIEHAIKSKLLAIIGM